MIFQGAGGGGRILLTFKFSPISCSFYPYVLCVLCICFVSASYALTLQLPVSGLSFMSIKVWSVLFC